MGVFEIVEVMEDQIPGLELISEEHMSEFLSALYWWYKERVNYFYADPPNIEDLLDGESMPPAYLENVMDAVAATIITNEGWEPDAASSYEIAYDIINIGWEDIMGDLRKDIKSVFDSLQLFHAEGIVTWDDGGNADWSAEKFYHSPIQEVW